MPGPAPLPQLAELWARGDARTAPEPAPDDAELARDRARFLLEARSLASQLRARWRDAPPGWNRATGNAELDALAWFRYVETEGP